MIITAIEITTNNNVYRSGFKNSMLKTMTVVISVTNVAANNVLAKSASGKFSFNKSSIQQPGMWLKVLFLLLMLLYVPASKKYVNSNTNRNGARNQKNLLKSFLYIFVSLPVYHSVSAMNGVEYLQRLQVGSSNLRV